MLHMRKKLGFDLFRGLEISPMRLLGKGYEIAFWDVFFSFLKDNCLILGKARKDFFVVFLILYLNSVFLLEIILMID